MRNGEGRRKKQVVVLGGAHHKVAFLWYICVLYIICNPITCHHHHLILNRSMCEQYLNQLSILLLYIITIYYIILKNIPYLAILIHQPIFFSFQNIFNQYANMS